MVAILRRHVLVAIFVFACACLVAGQTNPFVGTWKLVPERSHFDAPHPPKGTTLRFLIDKDQVRIEREITLWNGHTRSSVIIPQYDHQEHPFTISGETKHKTHAVLSTRVDDRTIEQRINHDNGLEYTTERLSISLDGQTLTETDSGKRPDGTPYEFVLTFVRQ